MEECTDDVGDARRRRRPMSRQVAHGVVWFTEPVKARVLDLMKAQSSAARSAYQAIHKHGLKGNAVKQYVKRNFMSLMNQRYISDAVSRVNAIEDENVLFGGKQSWADMRAGALAKEGWRERRNGQLYSRGDKTKSGNPNIRVVGDMLLVNDPPGRGKWLEGRLFIPTKWKPVLDCYDVRLLYRDGKFEVKVSWTEPDTPGLPTVAGAIGVDCNPDGVAVVEVTGNGNLKHSRLVTGDYVLATKYYDGDPCDHFCVGFFRCMLVDCQGRTTDRYLVADSDGHLFRANGFRRCERIQRNTGDILVAAFPYIGDKPGRSLWYWRRHLRELQDLINANTSVSGA